MTQVLPIVALAIAVIAVVGALILIRLDRRRHFGTPADQATFRTLHTAALASPPLRTGLNADSAERAVKHLRTLLGTAAVALTDSTTLLAWDGDGLHHHEGQATVIAASVLEHGRTDALGPELIRCVNPDCPVRQAVVTPLIVEDRVIGTLQAYSRETSAGLVRAVREVGRWVSGQLELAELDRSRTRAMEAEVRALRAQISPHFIYNSLTAIASFVRTDPERARDLLMEFADFTRYSFRRHGDFTTLAEELRSIHRYLLLEKARFGDRLRVTLQVAPEVLPVAIPYLCLQPLVENAVRHGLEGKPGVGEVSIVAADMGNECEISVEDDGVGMDPAQVARTLAGASDSDSIGLGNVNERLRAVFGEDFGLQVETNIGAGTKVRIRVPKFHPGVRAQN